MLSSDLIYATQVQGSGYGSLQPAFIKVWTEPFAVSWVGSWIAPVKWDSLSSEHLKAGPIFWSEVRGNLLCCEVHHHTHNKCRRVHTHTHTYSQTEKTPRRKNPVSIWPRWPLVELLPVSHRLPKTTGLNTHYNAPPRREKRHTHTPNTTVTPSLTWNDLGGVVQHHSNTLCGPDDISTSASFKATRLKA